MAWFSSDILYIRIRPDWLSIKSLPQNLVYEDVPQIAIQKIGSRFEVISIGRNARLVADNKNAGVLILNGFDHPRTIIADFEIAEKTLQEFLKKLPLKRFLKGPPVVIMHPLEKLEGGLTQVETRALEELGHRMEFKKIYVRTGAELSDEEVLRLSV